MLHVVVELCGVCSCRILCCMLLWNRVVHVHVGVRGAC